MSDARAAVSQPLPADTARDADVTAQLLVLRRQLLRQVRMVVSDAAVAEDLVQDTLLAVVQRQHTWRGEATLRTWAGAILKHKIADWYRGPTYRRLTRLDDDSGALAGDIDALYEQAGGYREAVPAWQQPENQAERKQMMQVLESCMDCLPAQTHRVFMMREWLGFETTEICARLGLSADNCRVILHRARMVLRDCMQRDWIGSNEHA
jgi:RNA polymerase sigma-70 factor, ECF subfamily